MAGIPQHDKEYALSVILPRLANGEPLSQILRNGGKGVPYSPTTIFDWMVADAGIAERVAQAREAGGDYIAAECLAISDKKPSDMVDVQHQRLQIDTRIKLLSKWHPKRYGDRLDITSNGETVTISPLAQLRDMITERAKGIHDAPNGAGLLASSDTGGNPAPFEIGDCI